MARLAELNRAGGFQSGDSISGMIEVPLFQMLKIGVRLAC
jgi:hypothetical protein